MRPAGKRRRLRKFVGVVAVFCTLFVGWAYFAKTIFTREEPRLSACSSDGVYCASVVLVINEIRSDYYLLRIKDMQHRAAWSHWADFGRGEVVLVTTMAGPSRLIWADDRHLAAICDSCKLAWYDVSSEKRSVGPVSISYSGFPPPVTYP